MPTIHLFFLAKELSFIKVTSRQGTRSDVAVLTSKGKISPDLLSLFAVPLLFMQATRQRPGFEPSSCWGSSLGLGTFPTVVIIQLRHLSLPQSGKSPWRKFGNEQGTPGNTLVPPHAEQGLCLVTTWGDASFPKQSFPTFRQLTEHEPTLSSLGFRGFKSWSYKFYFCIALHLLLSGTEWHHQGG